MQSAQFQLHADIEERHWWFVARRRIMRRLVEQLLPLSKHTTVIDVGCGTGANLAALADRYDCLGIDTSAEAVALAQQRFPQARFVCGRAPEDFPESFASASLVMLMDVLEHVGDDFQLLSSLMAAASPGTHFLITVPADASLWSEHDETFGHFRRYDLPRFERLWQGLPVTTLLASYFNARLYPLVKLARMRNRSQGKVSGQAGTDFQMPAAPLNRLLTGCFEGEAGRLARLLRSPSDSTQRRPYRRGVSLIAVLRREAGRIVPGAKPASVPADQHQPAMLEACSNAR